MDKTEVNVKNSKLELSKGNIVFQNTEAIVNAANKRLAPGGGVAGAIHNSAGPQLWKECKKLNGCETGEAKITKAYQLPNKYIIHTVGPVYHGTKEDPKLLKKSYLNSLKLADNNKIKSIAFPALSTGAFGYPIEKAAKIAFETIIKYLKGKSEIKLVKMVLHSNNFFEIHKNVLKNINKN